MGIVDWRLEIVGIVDWRLWRLETGDCGDWRLEIVGIADWRLWRLETGDCIYCHHTIIVILYNNILIYIR